MNVRSQSIHTKTILLAVLLALCFFSNCQSHTNPPITMKTPDTLQNRQPAVAGSFYPSDPAEIQQMLKLYFAKAPAHPFGSEVMAIISPHAGYVFSGEVAAAAFNQLDPEKEYKTIFILEAAIAIRLQEHPFTAQGIIARRLEV